MTKVVNVLIFQSIELNVLVDVWVVQVSAAQPSPEGVEMDGTVYGAAHL